MTKRFALSLLLVLGLALPTVAAAKDAPWIHIEVLESGGDEAKVNINVPLSLVDVALDMAEDQMEIDGDVQISNGMVRIHDSDVSVEDMRRMWRELREAGDAEFVTIEEKDESVKISRRGDFVFVNVVERHEGGDTVDIKIPVAMVDVLLQGTGEELNLKGALAELQKMPAGDILTVDGSSERVRIWID